MQRVFLNTKENRVDFLDEHAYRHNDGDVWLPSVTHILGVVKNEFLIKWMKEVGMNADKIIQEAANIGSQVHDLTERLHRESLNYEDLQGELINFKVWQMVCRYAEFLESVKPQLISNEEAITFQTSANTIPKGEVRGYGGTIDRVFKFWDMNVLLDVKTGKSVYNSNWMQVAAYANAWENKYSQKIHCTAVLHLNSSHKTKKTQQSKNICQGIGWQLQLDYNWKDKYELFLHRMQVWNDENPNWKPKHRQFPVEISIYK